MEFELWENDNGRCFAGDFIKDQGDKIATEIELYLDDLQGSSFFKLLKLAIIKKLKGDIYEIRLKIRGIQYRFLFKREEDKGWIVSGFIKKEQKTPPSEIKIAEKRAKEIQ